MINFSDFSLQSVPVTFDFIMASKKTSTPKLDKEDKEAISRVASASGMKRVKSTSLEKLSELIRDTNDKSPPSSDQGRRGSLKS